MRRVLIHVLLIVGGKFSLRSVKFEPKKRLFVCGSLLFILDYSPSISDLRDNANPFVYAEAGGRRRGGGQVRQRKGVLPTW